VLYPSELRVSRSLAKSLRNRGYEVRIDQSFPAVMDRCADPGLRPEGTWITPQMRTAYLRLHELGHAHSVETWRDGVLAGGLYGVALGRVFFGESMFSLERDASKTALCALAQALREHDWHFIDCQVWSPHLASLGARSLPRHDFMDELAAAVGGPEPSAPWRAASIALPKAFMQNSRGLQGR
jgi:leucyl/phenylalanyl-tRNA---protein transferase